MPNLVEISDEGAVGTITLNDPARMNLFSPAMCDAIIGAFTALAKIIGAEEARGIRRADEITDPGSILETAQQVARAFADMPPSADVAIEMVDVR